MENSTATYTICPDSSNCRTLFNIVWGCLATIFACTWVAVHPNVPARGQGWLPLACRRLGMMVLAIIAPELIVFFAARQYFFARAFSKKFGVSRTHGFFFAMGGFVFADGQYPITTLEQLEDALLEDEILKGIRAIDSGIIMDKSKGDALSKGVALLQSFWFIIQCTARFQQHLPITELEVATLAFAGVNIVTWVLWFKKPLSVQFPIDIAIGENCHDDCVTGFEWTKPELERRQTASPARNWLFRILGSTTAAIYGSENYNPASFPAVPTLWSPPMPSTFGQSFVLEVCVAAFFGAVHCAAWDANFSSVAEKWLWRSSALIITTIPALMGIITLSGRGSLKSKVIEVMFMVTMIIYILSRLLLIVLPFTTLRRMPAGALLDVNWSADIPHF
ncbi:hypothetical protein K438DRAFT_1772329 [Mycena galopus ATCC 62051]|nr:hypothetical protein K438DRAFT_1772329 [Mycena galopus ATCC 62051]